MPPSLQTFQVSIQVPTPPVNLEDHHKITAVLMPKKLHSISEILPSAVVPAVYNQYNVGLLLYPQLTNLNQPGPSLLSFGSHVPQILFIPYP